MARITFPNLSERVFAVRAAWRRQIPLRIRVEAVRKAASLASVPVNRVESPTQPSSVPGPPVRAVRVDVPDFRVA